MFWICSECKTFQYWEGAWWSAFFERPCSQCSARALVPIEPEYKEEGTETRVVPSSKKGGRRGDKKKSKAKKAAAAAAAAVVVAPVTLPAAPPLPKRAATPPPPPPPAMVEEEEEQDDGGGWQTMEGIRNAKFQDLPGPPLGAEGPNGVPANIRLAVLPIYRAQSFQVRKIRQSFRLNMASYYSEVRNTKSVKEFITDLAASISNRGLHNNYGTVFRNAEGRLPRSLLPADAPGQPQRSAYVEYGFRNHNIDDVKWYEFTAGNYVEASGSITSRINGIIKHNRDGGDVDLGDRIVIDQVSDDVYFSPDHYLTFFRYEGDRGWVKLR